MAVNPALGTQLQLETSTGPSVYTAIAQVLDIDGPSSSVASIETSHLGTTGAKTFRPSSLVDNGEVSFTIQYDPGASTHAAITTAFHTPTAKNWKIVFADAGAAEYGFSAFCTGFKPGAPGTEDNLTADVTLKISGAVTITP